MKTNGNINFKQDIYCRKMESDVMDNLIESFKKADKSQSRKLILVFSLLFVVGLSFLFILSLKTPLDEIGKLIIANVLVVALVIATMHLRKNYINKYKSDYSLPLLDVLKNAERKYRFWNSEWIFIVILIMVCNLLVSITFNFIHLSDQWTPARLTIFAQSIYLPLLGIAFLSEWITWKKLHKPLWKKSLELIKEIES